VTEDGIKKQRGGNTSEGPQVKGNREKVMTVATLFCVVDYYILVDCH